MREQEENYKYKELEQNLTRIINKGKAELEVEKLKKIAEEEKRSFDNDEFIYQIQGQMNVLEQRERKILDMSSTSTNEKKEPEYPEELDDYTLETLYISLLYGSPNAISKYYFEKDTCFF